MTIKWARMAENARKLDKAKKVWQDADEVVNADLDELYKDAKKHKYTLWRKENGTYFWENRYNQIANYPTLAEAIVAYGTETIDFS